MGGPSRCMGRHKILDHILRLDPERDHTEIVYLVTFHELIIRSLEFALFRTFAAPNIGGLLDRTGEFARRAQRRYDDTDLILSGILEHGYDSERSSAAIRRIPIAARDLFLGWVLPKPLYGLGEPVIYAMLDDPLLEAFGFPKPPLRLRQLVHGLLRARAKMLRLLPERNRPNLRTGPRKPTYPRGYRIEHLGPPVEDSSHGRD